MSNELARKLGVGLVAFFELTVSHLQGLKEAATAIFTDDTVAQATERYRQRAEQILATSREMWRDAEQAPSKVAAAADADVRPALEGSSDVVLSRCHACLPFATSMAGAPWTNRSAHDVFRRHRPVGARALLRSLGFCRRPNG